MRRKSPRRRQAVGIAGKVITLHFHSMMSAFYYLHPAHSAVASLYVRPASYILGHEMKKIIDMAKKSLINLMTLAVSMQEV